MKKITKVVAFNAKTKTKYTSIERAGGFVGSVYVRTKRSHGPYLVRRSEIRLVK